MKLQRTYFVWPRHILESDMGITRKMLRKVERAGVLKRSGAPAFARMKVKPFIRDEVERVFGVTITSGTGTGSPRESQPNSNKSHPGSQHE